MQLCCLYLTIWCRSWSTSTYSRHIKFWADSSSHHATHTSYVELNCNRKFQTSKSYSSATFRNFVGAVNSHLVRMSDHRLPKQVFFDELCAGIKPRGRPLRHHKDCLKTNLRRCNVRTGSLSPRTAANGAMHCSSGIQNFEDNRTRTIDRTRGEEKYENDVSLYTSSQSFTHSCQHWSSVLVASHWPSDSRVPHLIRRPDGRLHHHHHHHHEILMLKLVSA